jgi:Thiol-disulfide isomerase and thioredoxins
MTGIGPFPLHVLLVLLSGLLAWGITRLWARRSPEAGTAARASSLLIDALLVGLLAARLAYIAQWWPQYSTAPRAMLALGDGGYSLWAGLLAALGWSLWRCRQQPTLRRPVLAGLLAGVACWLAINAGRDWLQGRAPALPALTVTDLAGQPQRLASDDGRPLVLNLWATWCPPCRREMPVFARAQRQFPDVRVVLLNQGESASDIQAYLQQQGLALEDVLLDPGSQAMAQTGTRGLPSTSSTTPTAGCALPTWANSPMPAWPMPSASTSSKNPPRQAPQ